MDLLALENAQPKLVGGSSGRRITGTTYFAGVDASGTIGALSLTQNSQAVLDTSTSFSGDISGAYSAVTVGKLQGRAVYNAAPNNGDLLTWVTANSRWEPAPPSGGTLHYAVLDTTATTAQLNTALSNYNVVYLKPGVYTNVTGAITIPGSKQLIGLSGPGSGQSSYKPEIMLVTSGSVYVTMGRGSLVENIIWRFGTGSGAHMLNATNASDNATVRACEFWGYGVGTAYYAMIGSFKEISNCYIYRSYGINLNTAVSVDGGPIRILGCSWTGHSTDTGGNVGLYLGVSNVRVDNCYFEGGEYGIRTSNVSYLQLSNILCVNQVLGSASYGIYYSGSGGQPSMCSFSNIYVRGNNSGNMTGFYAVGDYNNYNGIFVYDTARYGIYINGSDYCTVGDIGAQDCGDAAGYSGVLLNAVTNTSIATIMSDGSGADGLRMTACSGCSVGSVTTNNNAAHGVNIASGNSNCTFDNVTSNSNGTDGVTVGASQTGLHFAAGTTTGNTNYGFLGGNSGTPVCRLDSWYAHNNTAGQISLGTGWLDYSSPAAFPAGTDRHVLTYDSGVSAWQSEYPGVVNEPETKTFVILDNTATIAQINTALTEYDTVYLKPGAYTITGTITVTDAALVGLGEGGWVDADGVYFTAAADVGATWFALNNGTLRNISCSYSGGTDTLAYDVITGNTTNYINTVDHVSVVASNAQTGRYALAGSFVLAHQLHTWNLDGVYFSSGVTQYGLSTLEAFYIGAAPTYGVRIGCSDVVVRNGYISGNSKATDYGVYYNEGTSYLNHYFQDVYVLSCVRGFSYQYSSGNRPWDINFVQCRAAGCTYGFYLDGPGRGGLTNCAADGASTMGFYVNDVYFYDLNACSAAYGAGGYEIVGASRGSFTGCVAAENSGIGFRVRNAAGSTFTGCSGSNNTSHGFYIESGNSDCSFIGLVANSNTGATIDGIQVGASQEGLHFSGCTANSNGRYGFNGGDSGTTRPCRVDATTASANTTSDFLIGTGWEQGYADDFVVLSAGAGAAQINAALSKYNTVYLKPGTYSCGSTQIALPAGKSLIGLGTSDYSPQAILSFSGSPGTAHIAYAGSGLLENFYIELTGVAHTTNIVAGSSNKSRARRVWVVAATASDVWGFYGAFTELTGVYTDKVDGAYVVPTASVDIDTIRNFTFYRAPTYGLRLNQGSNFIVRDGIINCAQTSSYGVYISETLSAVMTGLLFDNVIVSSPLVTGFHVAGTSSYDITAHFRNCRVNGYTGNTDRGFYATYADDSTWTDCYAEYCNGTAGVSYGAFVVTNSDRISMVNCSGRASSNTSNADFYFSGVNYSPSVSGLTSRSSTNGVYVVSSSYLGVSGVMVYDPSVTGFSTTASYSAYSDIVVYSAGSSAVQFSSLTACTVSDVSVANGASNGIVTDSCAYCNFNNLTGYSNRGGAYSGVLAGSTSYCSFSNITGYDNQGHTLKIYNATKCVFVGIAASHDDANGILVDGAAGCVVSNATIYASGGYGVSAGSLSYCTVSNVTTDSCGGLYGQYYGTPLRCTFTGNRAINQAGGSNYGFYFANNGTGYNEFHGNYTYNCTSSWPSGGGFGNWRYDNSYTQD